MIKLNIKEYPEIQSGITYAGTASFEGKTVKEVLKEIKEFAKDKEAAYLGDGFGNPNSKRYNAWEISINGIVFWTNWAKVNYKQYDNYTGQFDNETVKMICVNGGWFCFYNFNIITNSNKIIYGELEERTKQ